jgi:hypothetical protein
MLRVGMIASFRCYSTVIGNYCQRLLPLLRAKPISMQTYTERNGRPSPSRQSLFPRKFARRQR